MPRTAVATKSKARQEIPLDKQLNKEPEETKEIFYFYFQWEETGGEQGWNPLEAGQKHHYTSSDFLRTRLTIYQFTSRAKKMVKLLKAYKAQGKWKPCGLRKKR